MPASTITSASPSFWQLTPFRPKLDLQMGEFGNLVGLDVRAKAQPVTVEISLAAPEIVLHHVEIDHRAGRIQVLHKQLLTPSTPRARVFSATGRGPTMAACQESGSRE